MNVLSLFDGMSCAQLALKKLNINIDNYFSSELDRYAIKVTQSNFPETIQLGDVQKVTVNKLPKIDLSIGGSPCQGFSFAGRQLNFEDPRSKLFFEYVRILKELKEKNPDIIFLLENVRMKKESQDVISQYLGVEPIVINSNLVSAQNRHRLYWTNIKGVKQPENKNIKFQSVLERDKAQIDKAYTLTATYHKKGGEATRQRNFQRSQRPIAWIDDQNTRWLTPLECERLQTVPDNYTDIVSNTQRYKMLGNAYTVDVISHILGHAL